MDLKKIAFLGGGAMAEGIIAGIISRGIVNPNQITVSNKKNKDRLLFLEDNYGVITTPSKQDLVTNADIILLAMKPNDVFEAIQSIKPYISLDQLVISVIAGISTDSISHMLGSKNPIIRSMPNTSAAVGQSATALTFGEYATEIHMDIALQLFKTIGIVTIHEEKELHAVTALSGSGPAYIYYLVEAMQNAAVESGLDQEVAKTLILQTIYGATEMLKQTNKTPERLRIEVTSPGGTTEAGLSVLKSHNYKETISECIKQATKRSHELGEKLKAATK